MYTSLLDTSFSKIHCVEKPTLEYLSIDMQVERKGHNCVDTNLPQSDVQPANMAMRGCLAKKAQRFSEAIFSSLPGSVKSSYNYIINLFSCTTQVSFAHHALFMPSPAVLESLHAKRTAVRLTGLPLVALSFQTLGMSN